MQILAMGTVVSYISNLSAGTKADGLGIVLGRDIQASFGLSGLFGYQQVGERLCRTPRNIEWVYQLLFPKLCRFKQLLIVTTLGVVVVTVTGV